MPAGGFGAVVPVGCATPIAKGIVAAVTADTEQSATRNEAKRFAVKADFMRQIKGFLYEISQPNDRKQDSGPAAPSFSGKRGRIPKGRAADDTQGDLKLTG